MTCPLTVILADQTPLAQPKSSRRSTRRSDERNEPMQIAVNPGAGPVENSEESLAIVAMEQFIKDAKAVRFERKPKWDEDGRFGFKVYREKTTFEVLMPGLPLEQVRYMGTPGQNIWNYPRLYVDGGSWVWLLAIGVR